MAKKHAEITFNLTAEENRTSCFRGLAASASASYTNQKKKKKSDY